MKGKVNARARRALLGLEKRNLGKIESNTRVLGR